MRSRINHACVFIGMSFLVSATADDWPMWRHDSGRTGISRDSIPDSLKLTWVRHLPEIAPAYHNSRLQFDAGYEPVVAGGLLIVGSSKNDSLVAYDAATGRKVWTIRTNGPIRLAPAVWEQSVCFGSDDGFLYCVELKTGALRWKYQAVPNRRLLLGNKRLISVWPVRGGPVVADGKVYFAAGVWPFEGVFVYAMDIDSGAVVWRNDRLGYLFGQQPHNTEAIGGVAPQGYLVVNGDELIVPCSTAYPARLNRETGELIEFQLPAPGRLPGGWFAAIDDASARAIRRGTLVFDDVVNRQLHEDKVHKGFGKPGISRMIHSASGTLKFDDKVSGVEGTVHSMALSGGQLFVTTREGLIYCFSESDVSDKVKHWREPETPLTANATSAEFARKLVSESLGEHGYAIVVGLHDGAMIKSLVRESSYHIVAFDNDPVLIDRLRHEFEAAGVYGTRVVVIETDLESLELPPYIAGMLTTELSDRLGPRLLNFVHALRPFGGVAALRITPQIGDDIADNLKSVTQRGYEILDLDGTVLVRRAGALPGSSDYEGNWTHSRDKLVRFPLGVLWFDDTLAHFKRSPQPRFSRGLMISRPKDWHAPRVKGEYATDYPLLPPVLSDIYTGRVLSKSEHPELRAGLGETDPTKPEPSQYRPPRQKDAWKPDQPIVGTRTNPLTGEREPRAFPKTYGCDGGVDYGDFFTLRSGTPAFYDKTLESGTVFLSGPRSGCTNSVIPAGGLLNVPYFFEGCTCSYPLPTALSLVSMPEDHEQWSSWGTSKIKPNSIERIGLNFGAPGDRMTREGTLWLDYPSVGGPSPAVRVETIPANPATHYQHSLWMNGGEGWGWVTASMMEGVEQVTIRDLKPGRYVVSLYFAEPEQSKRGDRVQTISVQGKAVLQGFDIVEASSKPMQGVVRKFTSVVSDGALVVRFESLRGETLVSGIEAVRQP